jgi:hypothetical protein
MSQFEKWYDPSQPRKFNISYPHAKLSPTTASSTRARVVKKSLSGQRIAPTKLALFDHEEIPADRTVIYNRYHTVSDEKRWVEISFCDKLNQAFIVMRKPTVDATAHNCLCKVMDLQKATALLEEDNNEAQTFVSRMSIQDDRILVRDLRE